MVAAASCKIRTSSALRPAWCRSLLYGVAALLFNGGRGLPGAAAQVCRVSGGATDAQCGAARDSLRQTVSSCGEAALWASAQVPEGCDSQSPACSWAKAADAWRYAFNNLRLAVESASDADKEWLPLAEVRQVHAFVSQLGHQEDLWYGNWQTAAGFARQLLDQLRPWLATGAQIPVVLPHTDIGTRFPSFGRSVTVPANGDMSATVTLANGFAMPVLGFGTWELPADGTAYQSVRWALELGYRHIDTAQAYGNEHEVGRAMRDSGVPRQEICLVTKLSHAEEYSKARERFEQQLQVLGVDYVDIYMLHSPGNSPEARKQAWQQMEQLYDDGRIRALGISNFNIATLQELLEYARIRPVYIQNKYSIYSPGSRDEALQEASLMEWLVRERMVLTGYSIIHPGHGSYLSPMEDPHVLALAEKHRKTASQVLHRWLLQLGGAVIPRSTKRERIRENGDLFSFVLSETDMRLLNGIASLLKSTPGAKAPAWCDDVYGLQALAAA